MKQIGVLRKQDNFVGVLRKQVGGMEAELIQSGANPAPQVQFRTTLGGKKGSDIPLRGDRGFGQMLTAGRRGREAAQDLANIQSRRETIDRMGALDDKAFADAQAAQRQEQINKPILESRMEAAKPQTYQEKYGMEAARRTAPKGGPQMATAYRRGGLGGTVGRALGAGAAGAYGGLQALLALNRAGAAGQDLPSALGGAALQGVSSYGTTAPTAQNIGGEVGSRVAVRGGQVMDEGRDFGQGVREGFREGMQPAEPTVATEPPVAVQRTPRPRLTPQQISYQQQMAQVRADANRERLEQDRAAQQRARGNVPVLGPTAPPPAAPAPPASSTPMTMDNSSQSKVEDFYDKQQKQQQEQQMNEQKEAENKVDPLKKLTEQAQPNSSVQGGF